jgi:catechol 2,3-dioxygenase-like lactoylglutathione lyase family enzyme
VEHRELDPAVAVRGAQHGDVLPDVVDPDDALHPTPLDRPPALQLHAEFDEERNDSVKVVDDIEDVIARLRTHGAELVGEPAQYEDSFRLCYVRGPEGIIVGLAQQVS